MIKDTTLIQNNLFIVRNYIIENDINIEILNNKDIRPLMHIFSKFNDFRDIKRTSYKIDSMIMMILVSKICWRIDSFLDIEWWCKTRCYWLKEVGIIKDLKVPSHDTFRRFFIYFNFESIQDYIVLLIEKLFDKILKHSKKYKKEYKQLCVDGKEFRGSGRKENTLNPHSNLSTLNIYDAGNGTCILNKELTSKDSEIKAFQELIPSLDCKRVIFTGDALHCQRKTCKLIKENKGDYIFAIKNNQESIKRDIELVFSNKLKYANDIKVIKRNNRTLYIQLIESKELSDIDMIGTKAYIKMISTTHNKKESSQRYFISSLNSINAIVEGIENRWEIEGTYHMMKDKYLYEDNCTCEDKRIIKNMSIMNSIIVSLYLLYYSLAKLKRPKEARLRLGVDTEENLFKLLNLLQGRSLAKLINQTKKEKGKTNFNIR